MKYYSIKVTNHPYKSDVTYSNIWAENVKQAKQFVKRYLCEGSKIKDMQFVKSYNEPID